jgi:transcription-repair coupling factor (superfamily II helicase)
MIDRFGLLPEEAKSLIELTELKLAAMSLGIKEIRVGEAGGRIKFIESPNIDPLVLIRLLQSAQGRYRMEGPQILHLDMELPEKEQRLRAVRELLAELGQGQTED